MLFYGAEESNTSILVGSLSLLEGLKFLVYTGFGESVSLGYFSTVISVKVFANFDNILLSLMRAE